MLLDAKSTPGEITEEGLRNDISVGFQYISFWLGGRGAAGINNLMEDAATAEISRSQIWQQQHNKVVLADTGNTVTAELVDQILAEETERLRGEVDPAEFERHYLPASRLIGELATGAQFVDFLTLPAYELVT